MHDPVVVAVLLDSVLDGHISFDDRKGERWIVNVVTDRLNSLVEEGRGQVGRTVVTKSNSGGVRIPRGLDVESFWVAVERCLQQAERAISDT